MTIEIDFLEGDWEDFDSVILNLIDKNWEEGNPLNQKPDLVSATRNGIPRVWPKMKSNPAIYFNLGNETELEHSNGFGIFRYTRMLMIDIFGPTDKETGIIARQVNDILAENYPNGATRILKTNGTENSAIAGFDKVSIDFIKPPFIDSIESDRHSQLSGYLGIIWNKVVT